MGPIIYVHKPCLLSRTRAHASAIDLQARSRDPSRSMARGAASPSPSPSRRRRSAHANTRAARSPSPVSDVKPRASRRPARRAERGASDGNDHSPRPSLPSSLHLHAIFGAAWVVLASRCDARRCAPAGGRRKSIKGAVLLLTQSLPPSSPQARFRALPAAPSTCVPRRHGRARLAPRQRRRRPPWRLPAAVVAAAQRGNLGHAAVPGGAAARPGRRRYAPGLAQRAVLRLAGHGARHKRSRVSALVLELN